MHEYLDLTWALGAGVLLGALFFGGLWWTVRRGLSSTRPVLWFLGSMLTRTSLTVIGFYWVGGNNLSRLLACLAGFAIARAVVSRWARSGLAASGGRAEADRHAA